MTLAAELEAAFDRLWNVWPPRSITGNGVRKTHDILEEISGQKFTRIEVPTATTCFDWQTPEEWVLRKAYVVGPGGEKVIDARANHLAVCGYSAGYRGTVSRAELDRHLWSRSDLPDATPYITKYYGERDWGFCISQRARDALVDGDYRVEIDAEFINGSLPICELVLPGTTDREILMWSYSCHPAGAHHDLSANLAWSFLARRVAAWKDRRYTYRFVIGPETIGSLAYLARLRPDWAMGHFRADVPYALVVPDNADFMKAKLSAGFVVTCLGRGAWNYKRSRRGDTLADRAAEYVLLHSGPLSFFIHDFSADKGSDELQFCSQGINLPVGSLMRLPYGSPGFPEYHTDQDSKETISFDCIAESIDMYERILLTLEANRTYRATITHGMPQLGRRGLYDDPEAITPLIQFSDGQTDLIAIARKTGISVKHLAALAKRAESAGVLEEV